MARLRVTTTLFSRLIFLLFLSAVEGEKPTFLRPVTEVYVDKGATAVLPCSIKNLYDHTVVWTDQRSTLLTYEDRRIIDNERISVERPFVTSWDLHIRVATVSDSGVYTCQINTSPVMTHSIQLHVLEPDPQFEEGDTQLSARVGQTVTLTCAVKNIGTSTIKWLRDSMDHPIAIGAFVYSSDDRYSIDYGMGDNGITSSNLTIRDVSAALKDTYKCSVSNKRGDFKKEIQLEIIQTGFGDTETKVYVEQGTTAVLKCSVQNLGNHMVAWLDVKSRLITFGDRRVIDDGRISVERPDASSWNLHIRNVLVADSGAYICDINTSPAMGHLVELHVLNVQRDPEFEDTDTDLTVEEGQTVTLSCAVKNLGTKKILWRKGSEPNPVAVAGSIFIAEPRYTVQYRSGAGGIMFSNLTIHDVTAEDADSYDCTISSKRSSLRNVFRLEVTDVQVTPVFLDTASEVRVNEGTTAVLPCGVENLGSHKVLWADPTSTIITVEDRRVVRDRRISIERPFVTSWDLHIRDVSGPDAGRYSCRVNTDPPISHTVSLVISSAPIIVHSSGDVVVREFSTVSLWCNATGSPQPTISWYRTINGEEEALADYGTALLINNVTRKTAGMYTCRAANSVGTTDSPIRVMVQFAPTIEMFATKVTQKLGEFVVLDCLVTSSPEAITWWKFGNYTSITNEDTSKHSIGTYVPGKYTVDTTLKIKNLTKSDLGTYRCTALNVLGRADAMVEVAEQYASSAQQKKATEGAPTIEVSALSVAQHLGGTVFLECLVTSLRGAEIRWRFGDELIPKDSPNYSIGQFEVNSNTTSSSLKISKLKKSDLGFYTCEATNPNGDSKVVMEVRDAEDNMPSFGDMPTDVTVQTGSTAVLPCVVVNLERHKVGWTRESVELMTLQDKVRVHDPRVSLDRPDSFSWNLHITNVSFSDSGQYSCFLNTKPPISHYVTLRVTGFGNTKTEVMFEKGTTAVLPCEAINLSNENVAWTNAASRLLTLDEKRISEDSRFSVERPNVSSWNLHIRNVSLSDTGVYSCVVNTTHPMTRQVTLVVSSAPTMEVYGLKVAQQLGGTVLLHCTVTASPVADILWKFGDEIVVNDSLKYTTAQDVPEKYTSTSSLKISNLTNSDLGNYTCEALHPSGNTSRDIQVMSVDQFRATCP